MIGDSLRFDGAVYENQLSSYMNDVFTVVLEGSC